MWLFVDFLFALELLGGDRQCKKCVIAEKYVQVGATETNEPQWRNMNMLEFPSLWIGSMDHTRYKCLQPRRNDFLSLQGMKKSVFLCLI